MTDLTKKSCKPCEGGVEALSSDRARAMLARIHDGWSLAEDGRSIARAFSFANFHEVMAFVNAVAWVAHREDHHPDLEVGYSRVAVAYSTHAIGGLSENDFICAAKVDALV
jgi:4a-hydroxytetrahydrobiopterin dehydratase